MKFIILLQLSVVSDTEHLLQCDSNYNFNIALAKALKNSYPYLDVKLILPSEYPEIYSKDVIASRFSANVEMLEKMLLKEHPDIILENNPTNVALLHYLRDKLKQKYVVYTYNHWLDTLGDRKVPSDYTYMYRQFEGHLLSAKSGFNSSFAINLFAKNSFNLFNTQDVNCVIKKCYKLPPLVDYDLLNTYTKTRKQNIIIYNHRLSSLPYYKKAIENFSKILKYNKQLLNKYKIVFTNPGKKLFAEIKEQYFKDFTNIITVDTGNYSEYLKLLSSCKLGVCLFENPGMWSISAVEASFYMPVIGLYHSGYSECLNIVSSCYTVDDAKIKLRYFLQKEKTITNRSFIKNELDIKDNKYVKDFFGNLVWNSVCEK